MKNLLLCLFPTILFAQSVATFSPVKPEAGATVTITYNSAAKAAVLRSVPSITAEVMTISADWKPVMIEVPLTKAGSSYKGSFMVKPDHRAYAIQFSRDEKTDNNNDLGWSLLVHEKGVPAENALAMRGQWYAFGRAITMKFEKSPDKAKADYETEVKLRPTATSALIPLWRMQMQQDAGPTTLAKIKDQLESVYTQKKDDEKTVASLLSWFTTTGQKERGDHIAQDWISRFPKGVLAKNVRLSQLTAERDPLKRMEMMEAVEADFPTDPEEKDARDQMYASIAMAAKQNDKVLARLATMARPDPMMYNNIAWASIEKGENLEAAVAAARIGVDLLKRNDPAQKPAYLTTSQWDQSRKYQLGMMQDTYGYGLEQLGRIQEAMSVYGESFTNLNAADEDVNARYVSALVKDRQYAKALQVAADVVLKGKANDKVMDQYKAAYIALKGSDAGFDAEVATSKDVAKKNERSKVKGSMIDKPSVDFALKALDGTTVKLSKLRGKVVVLDFWATWCGPCKASFPYLQKVYEKYKDNSQVMILAVNTWEHDKGEARETTVRKFIADNKYSFPVVFDEDFVSKYGVEGIPTKFILDKKGRVRFKDVGFSGGPEMMDKMDQQFELLLGEKD